MGRLANPNIKDDAGLSPLHWAVVRGNKVCIRRLIEHGADLNAKDGEDRTPREMAVELRRLGSGPQTQHAPQREE